ncbi:lipopolysaccharide biosynthesis protein [Dyadobacter sp. CY347]|uniref:lipopolysaccharide biosynthesis protein n=1 Tax=Dyadobacter sp. CY347 TaxID=2909336 RepID=UPI001F17CB2C|nr:lipopolysaccharide biosynthesis protein [Dyadobacter sp. CY347]MCF2491094.1 lipopolysaccharide biosynthesis protein [Dyadobacter sp. CY347]
MQIQQEIRKGTVIVFISRYSGVLIGILINSSLARLLSPSEFGVLGVVTVFITFFNILSDIGIGSGIVQNQNLDSRDTSDIFKLSVLLSITLAIAFFLFSYLIADFYSNKEYIKICQLLAINLFFSSIAVVPRNLLIKARAFKVTGLIDTCTALFTGIFAIFLALNNFSYYSMIWRSIVSSVIVFSLYYIFSGLKLQSKISLVGIRKIAGYSSYQFAFNFINYFSRNLDNILIGKYMGNASLGVYGQAYQLMIYPIAYLTNVITPVLHPILAKFQDNKPVIFQEYTKVAGVLATLGFPISIFIFFAADEIIITLLGRQWLEVIPILKILSFSVWLQMILSSSGSIFQAAGRTDLLFLSGFLSAVLTIASILFGIFYFKSLSVTATLLVVSYYVNFIQAFYLLISIVLKSSLWTFFKTVLRPLPMAITLAGVFILFNRLEAFTQISLSVVFTLLIKLGFLAITFMLFEFSTLKKLSAPIIAKFAGR